MWWPIVTLILLTAPSLSASAQDTVTVSDAVVGLWLERGDACGVRGVVSRGAALDELLFCHVTQTRAGVLEWKLGHLIDTIAIFTTGEAIRNSWAQTEYRGTAQGGVITAVMKLADTLSIYFPEVITGPSYQNIQDTMQFVCVRPNLTQYINRLVMTGEYVDSVSGRRFAFLDTGEGLRDSVEDFSYEVPLLSRSDNRGILKIGGAKGFFEEALTYGFRWWEDGLHIFPARRDSEFQDEFIISDSPIVILKPIQLANPQPITPRGPGWFLVDTWLSSQYVELLGSSRSPKKAFDQANSVDFWIAIEVSKCENKWIWVPNNFHEANYIFECGLDEYPHQRRIVFRSSYDSTEIMAEGTLYSPDTLLIEYRSKYNAWTNKFIRAKPTLEQFVNRMLLAGSYVDQDGITCDFGESGVADWGGVLFKYVVLLDYMFLTPDGFYLPFRNDLFGADPFYHFKWKEGKLHIYETHYAVPGSELRTAYNEPLLILTPVKE